MLIPSYFLLKKERRKFIASVSHYPYATCKSYKDTLKVTNQTNDDVYTDYACLFIPLLRFISCDDDADELDCNTLVGVSFVDFQKESLGGTQSPTEGSRPRKATVLCSLAGTPPFNLKVKTNLPGYNVSLTVSENFGPYCKEVNTLPETPSASKHGE